MTPPLTIVLGRLALLCASLATLSAYGQAQAPSEYPPGWAVAVRKAGGDLARPSGESLAAFAAPAVGFDFGSYRSAVPNAFTFGIAYDATGLFDAAAQGRYEIAATLDWGEADESMPEAHCAVGLRIENQALANWSGTVGRGQGSQALQGGIDLQAGYHPAALTLACDQPLQSRLRLSLAWKRPGESDFRPLAPDAIVHAPGRAAGMGMMATSAAPPRPPTTIAPAIAPPAPASAPPPPAAARPLQLVATADLTIRSEPDPRARRVGRAKAGQTIAVAEPEPHDGWYRLADGGYASAAFLKPDGAAGPARPEGRHASRRYKPGDCAPYSLAADMGGGETGHVTGTACLQPDGRWRIVR